MPFLLNGAYKLLSFLLSQDVFAPTKLMLYCVLIIVAFLTAGVALAIFSFYEDHYWGDQEFREQLRLNQSLRDDS